MGSCSFEKKKGDISTSTIDESLQITELGETACYSTDETLEPPSPLSSLVTTAAATETSHISSYVSCSSKKTTTLILRRSPRLPAFLEDDSLEKFAIFRADRSR